MYKIIDKIPENLLKKNIFNKKMIISFSKKKELLPCDKNYIYFEFIEKTLSYKIYPNDIFILSLNMKKVDLIKVIETNLSCIPTWIPKEIVVNKKEIFLEDIFHNYYLVKIIKKN